MCIQILVKSWILGRAPFNLQIAYFVNKVSNQYPPMTKTSLFYSIFKRIFFKLFIYNVRRTITLHVYMLSFKRTNTPPPSPHTHTHKHRICLYNSEKAEFLVLRRATKYTLQDGNYLYSWRLRCWIYLFILLFFFLSNSGSHFFHVVVSSFSTL